MRSEDGGREHAAPTRCSSCRRPLGDFLSARPCRFCGKLHCPECERSFLPSILCDPQWPLGSQDEATTEEAIVAYAEWLMLGQPHLPRVPGAIQPHRVRDPENKYWAWRLYHYDAARNMPMGDKYRHAFLVSYGAIMDIEGALRGTLTPRKT